ADSGLDWRHDPLETVQRDVPPEPLERARVRLERIDAAGGPNPAAEQDRVTTNIRPGVDHGVPGPNRRAQGLVLEQVPGHVSLLGRDADDFPVGKHRREGISPRNQQSFVGTAKTAAHSVEHWASWDGLRHGFDESPGAEARDGSSRAQPGHRILAAAL